MKCLGRAALACAVLVGTTLAPLANANVVDFEDLSQDLFGPGDSFTSGGFSFTAGGSFGAIAEADSFFFGTAPTGNASQFFAALNDGSVTITNTVPLPFVLTGLDAGFIPLIPGFYAPGEQPGELLIRGSLASGGSITVGKTWGGADGSGLFAFQSFGAFDLGLSGATLTSVTIKACTYDGLGDCLNPFGNQNQFAIDNIVISSVPEPTALMMAMLGLAVVGGAVRRRRG